MVHAFSSQRRTVFLLLTVVVLAGALLRLHGLDRFTVGHIEIYVPNIKLPPIEYSDPPPRLSLIKSISGPVLGEPHPPGYYMLMFFWTELFGTSVWALRLPSVLFGVASIPLLFLLARLTEGRWTSLLAATLLAFHGYHIFWSQTAKMYIMGCFLAILSSLLLLWTLRDGRRWFLPYLYAGVTLAGLGTVIFFWPVFLTQLLWLAWLNLRQRQPLSGFLQMQLLLFILASPLLAVAAYQSQRPSYLSSNLLADAREFLQFGFLLEPTLFAPDPWLSPPNHPAGVALIGILAVVALFLLAVGVRTERDALRTLPALPGVPGWLPAPTGLVVCGAIFLFAWLVLRKGPSPTGLIVATGAIPLLLVLLDALLRRRWRAVQALVLHRSSLLDVLFSRHLVVWLAVLPAVTVLLVSLAVPIFEPRTALLFVPFLLVVLAKGLAALLSQQRRWAVLGVLLVAAYTLSIVHFKQRLPHPTDYRGLAEQWIPDIEDQDIIFIQRHWATTPIFYYLDPDRYQFIAWEYAAATEEQPNARVWLLSFEDLPNPEAMDSALAGYQVTEELEALRIKAELFERAPANAELEQRNDLETLRNKP